MDREKAIEIHKLLQDVAEAYQRAEVAIGELDRDDHVAFANQLGAVSKALHWELLPVMYKMYPDLRPPSEEPPHIISTLRWEEVSLPPNEIGLPVSDQIIAARIEALAEAGFIENQGDVRKWRHSEVRLKADSAATRPN